MNDTTRLIDQLRLDRDAPAASVRHGRGLIITLVTATLLGTAALAWRTAEEHAAIPPVPLRPNVAEPAPAAPVLDQDGAVLNASGYIVARRHATVSANITARLKQVLIEEGQRVEEGEVIAVLDDAHLLAGRAHQHAQRDQARASQHAAQLALANEEPLFQRARSQLERGISTQQDFDVARARFDAAQANFIVVQRSVAVAEAALAVAARNLDDTVVRAPFAGIVTGKSAQPGEIVSPVSAGGGFTRTGIGTIVDMDSLEVEVDVSESFINRVVPGQAVVVRLNAYPDWALAAHVITIVPTADRAKGTVKVRVALEQRDPRILPDMGARVAFLTDNSPER